MNLKQCTASDSEGRDLGAVFSRLIALVLPDILCHCFECPLVCVYLFFNCDVNYHLQIEDAAYIECEPTPGRGKESFIMVRHVKFGPPKGGGKKTKAEDNKIPEKGGDDGIGVTTRSDTVPLPPQESSGEAENRYRKIEARNQISPTREMDSKGETTNKGEPHIPYQRRETPTNSHFSPSMRDPRIPYQRREAPTNSHFSSPMRESNRAETTPSAFRNSAPLPNGIPKQEPSSPNPPRSPGLRQEPFIPNSPRSRSPGLGYGIFSTPTGNGSAKQGVSERVPANPNSPSSRP